MKKQMEENIRKRLRRGEPVYYNRFSQIGVVVTNSWETIRKYNNLGDFPGWINYALIHDLDFQSLDQLLEGEKNRNFLLEVELF